MYTVAQAAQILGVAAVTLRLWERQGKITSNRTIGGQRRYSEEDIQRIRNLINLPRIQSPATPPVPRPKPHLTLPQKRVLLGTAAALIISAAGFVAAKSDLLSNITPFNPPLKLREGVGGELWSFFQRPSSASIALSDSIRGTVLASQTRFEDLLFKVNIPAEFARDIKAPNILYGLKAGDGIDISAGQTPTISTNLQTFKTVKVGGTNISAGSKADTLELAAGSNVTLSTSDKKITIAASATDVTTSGWTDDGTILRLTTVGDIVAIGAASGAAKLNINADDLRDLITASQAGSLKFRLTNAGIIDTGTWNGSVIGPAYGGTGIANNAASTLTLSGNYATTLTLTGTTGITLPTSGTLYGTATDSITSSQLLTSLSDETGTGVAVFGTSPTITTSITTPSTTFALVNTTATTVNFAGAATSLNLGAATGTTTINNAASISGALTLFGTPTLQGTALQTLTLGGTTTGNIVIDSGSSVINLPDLTASRAVFTDSSSNLSSTAASAALLNSLSDETGTGVAVFGTSPTLTTPVISQIVNTGTLTLPTSTDTLVGRATTDTLTNKTWNGNTIGAIYGGTGQSTWTTGDLLYASGTNALSKLGIGSDGQALTVSSGVPIWAGGSGSGTVGWWQRNLGVLAPTNITDDLAVGGTATSSAKFQIFGASGNATTSGTLTFNAGNQIQTTKNETLTIGGSTTGNIVLADSISGDITFLDDVAINGGDLTTTQTTATLFNTTATTVNLAGAGTTITIGAATGTTTINNSLSVLGSFTLGDNGDTGSINTSDWDISTTGDLTGIGGITANGAIAFSPTSTSDITFTTDADSTFVVSGLSTTSGSGLCLDASNNVIICSSGSGSSLWTLSGSTIYPNLASYDALVGSITAGDGVGKFTVSGAKTGKALVVLNETGDQAIWTASASGTTVANLDRSGNLAVEGTISDLGGATLVVADDLQINEGDLLTDDTTFNLINATATTLNIGGAATTISLGASTGTTTINNSATVTGDLGVNGGDITSSATSFNLLQSTVTTLNLGGAATTLSIGASTGTTTINNANTVISGDLAVNGGDLTTTATTFNLVNATATTLNIGGAATTLSIGATTGTTTIANDLTIGNAITDAITFTGRVAADSDLIPIGTTGTNDLGSSSLPWDNLYVTGVTAAGDISFAPTGTFDVTFTTDSDSTVIFNGLATSTGSGLCLDGSNNIIVCSAGSGSSLWTLSGSTVYANSAAYNILIGSTSTSDDIGKLTVSGAKTGKALAVLNETGDQNVLEASASGVPVLSITRTGNIVFEGTTNNDFETTLSLTDPSADRTITLPNATGTVCLDSDNCTGGTAGPWGEASGVVFLDTSTNNVNVGGSANLGKLAIDGDTDEIQFLIQGNSTQTANLLTLENSSGTDQSWFDESANLRIGASAADTGLVNVTGAFTGKALLILNETGDQAIWTASASGTTVATLGRTGNLSLTVSSSSNADINLSSTGDFTVSDAGVAFATFSDTGYLDLDSLRLDGTTIGLTTDTDLLSLAANELTVNGSIVATADVAVNGGDLTSSATTFNLLNATVTTLNLGGAATTVSLGAATGTTTVNNTLSITGTLDANGIADIGDGGDAITLSGTTITLTANTAGNDITLNLVDNNTDALDIQESTNNYINVNTTNSSENISFGNATTNPSFSFLGSGTTTFTGDIAVNGDDITSDADLTINPAGGDILIDDRVTIGSTTAGVGKLTVTGAEIGKALLILNETGDQNILTASAAGVTKFTIANSGNITATGTVSGLTGISSSGTTTLSGLTASRVVFTDASSNLATIGASADLLNALSDETGTGVAVFATSPTLTTPRFADLGYLADSSGNELLILDSVASAVNELTLANAAAGNGVTLAATGGDSAVALSIDAKGTGALNLNNTATGDILIGGGSASTGCTITNSTGALACAGTINGATISSGAWNGSVIGPAYGGTGIANNAASTLTISGNFATTLTVSGTTGVTLPTSGTLYGTATDSITSSQLLTSLSDETGSGVAVFGTSPAITTSLTTPSTTFALLNTTATTVNFAGAATALNLGAATGTTTINNANTVVSGDLAVNGADVTSTATTVNLFNSTVTTLNLGGAATTNLNAVTLSGHLTLSSDASEGLSGGGLTDCDTAATSKLLWDTTTNKFSCGTDQNSGGGGSSNWRITNGALSPINDTLDVLIGNSASASAKFAFLNVNSGTPTASVSGNLTLDAAGVIATTKKQTLTIGDANTGNIAIGPNSNSTTIGNSTTSTALNFTSGTGSQTFASSVATTGTTSSAWVFTGNSLTSGTGAYINSSSLTTGTLFNLATTATSLTSGSLAVFDWSPGSATTATGDLFKINIGTNGTTTGDLFVVGDAGSDLFSVSETAITSSLPHSFTAAGDVSVAYDLLFTNQTASYIKSNAPLYIEAGESFENNNLTLRTYGTGQVVTDSSFNGTNITSRDDETAASTNTITGRGMVYYLHADSNTTDLDFTTTYNVTGVPDTFGTVMFINSVAEKGISTGSRTHTVTVQINGTQVSSVPTATGTAASTVKESYTIVRSYDGWKIVGSTGSSDSADYSEQFLRADDVESAEVVALGASEALKVERGSTANVDRVIGVTSTSPAFTIGEEFDTTTGKIPVALAGRTPVKISASSAPIQIGDTLTASQEPGKATKATRPGRTIGKALESWTPNSGKDRILMFIANSWSDPGQFLAFDESGNLTVSGTITAQNVVVKDNPVDTLAPEIANLRTDIASISAELAQLKLNTSPLSFPSPIIGEGSGGEIWVYATESGKLTSIFDTQVPSLTITGKLQVGLLSFDDLEASISSLTGTITVKGDLAVSGSIKVLGASAGKAIIPAGSLDLSIDNSLASTTSAIFVTPEDPVAVSGQSTQSGQLTVRIPQALSTDLKFQWWIVN